MTIIQAIGIIMLISLAGLGWAYAYLLYEENEKIKNEKLELEYALGRKDRPVEKIEPVEQQQIFIYKRVYPAIKNAFMKIRI